jgi:hypothetical protein
VASAGAAAGGRVYPVARNCRALFKWSNSVQEHEQRPTVHPTQAGNWLCWKCEEIDKVILGYRRLSTRVTDSLTLEGLQQLIEKLEAEKKRMHPDQKE